MIVLVDLCYREGSLSRDEYVAPVEQVVRDAGYDARVVHYTRIDPHRLQDASAVIICGTAYADCLWRESIDLLSWIPASDLPLLGICGGMQAMAMAEGGSLMPCREIGMIDVRIRNGDALCEGVDQFSAFACHRDVPSPPPPYDVVAESTRCPQMISHRDKPRYGVLFHPEVRNEWLIHRFLDLAQEGTPAFLRDRPQWWND